MNRLIPFIFAFILLVSLIPFSVSASAVEIPTNFSYNPSGRVCSTSFSSSFSYTSLSDYSENGFPTSKYLYFQSYSQHETDDNVYYSFTWYFYFESSLSEIKIDYDSGIYHIYSSSSNKFTCFPTSYSDTISTSDFSVSSGWSKWFFHNNYIYDISDIIYNSDSCEFYYKSGSSWYKIRGIMHDIQTNIFNFSDYTETTTTTPETSTETTTTTIKDFGEEQLNVSNSILDNVKNLVSSIINLPAKIADSIQGFFISLGNVIIDKLEYLFVPSGDNYFSDVKEIISEKFGIFNQLFDLAGVIIHYEFSDEPPNFNITLYGHTVTIVDWELFAKYRLFIHGIIIFIAYYFFIQKLIKRVPQIIRGI